MRESSLVVFHTGPRVPTTLSIRNVKPWFCRAAKLGYVCSLSCHWHQLMRCDRGEGKLMFHLCQPRKLRSYVPFLSPMAVTDVRHISKVPQVVKRQSTRSFRRKAIVCFNKLYPTYCVISMNWTGGKLSRHAKSNHNSVLKAQKQHFARATLFKLPGDHSQHREKIGIGSTRSLHEGGLLRGSAGKFSIRGEWLIAMFQAMRDAREY